MGLFYARNCDKASDSYTTGTIFRTSEEGTPPGGHFCVVLLHQAFLAQARSQGYPRARNETPHEFRQRLDSQEPLLEPELEAITEAYALARYGGHLPRAAEFTRLLAFWHRLSGKWRRETS
jgi:hypothetical protein